MAEGESAGVGCISRPFHLHGWSDESFAIIQLCLALSSAEDRLNHVPGDSGCKCREFSCDPAPLSFHLRHDVKWSL